MKQAYNKFFKSNDSGKDESSISPFEALSITIATVGVGFFITMQNYTVSGAALTLSAFEHGLGSLGRIILTLGILLFGVTTSSGLYAQIEVLLRYVLGDNSKSKDKILTIYKWAYPIPGLALVIIAVVNELPGVSVWLFADMSTALPIFANILALLILSPKFLSLLKDYKARHMGIGEINPNFKVFYEEEKETVR